MNYVISIIENLGGDMARQCYWDVGRWSDLWRVWRLAGDDRPIIDGIEFQVCSIQAVSTHQKAVCCLGLPAVYTANLALSRLQ